MAEPRQKRAVPEGTQLSALQLDMLRVVWARPGATVLDVHETLARTRKIATSTVATVLTRLEERGIVKREKRGRQFRYHATLTEDEATDTMVSELAERVFQGDAAALVCRLLETDALDSEELERVRALIDRRRRNIDGRAS